MSRRRRISLSAVGMGVVFAFLALLVLWGDLGAAPEEAAVGDIRATLAKDGTPLRERPTPLSHPVDVLAYGTKVRIQSRRGAWVEVATLPTAGTMAKTGWLRATQTVEPFALTEGGQRGPIAEQSGGPTQNDLQAAGRQFDPATENSYREAHPDLRPYFGLVDEVEHSAPSPDEVDAFVLEGRLGRPGRTR